MSPLGPSYVLLPLPGDDDSLLGRVLTAAPDGGRSLEEVTRPNACADKLSEPRTTPLANTFEDAEELAVGGKARAMLGPFGFEADVQRATHFLYRLQTSKRSARTDTTDYAACCQAKGCGYGFVSALIYGDGEYSTAEETTGSASANVAVVTGSGNATVKVLHRRTVHGYVAALVTVTDPKRIDRLGPLGVAKEAGISEATVSDQVKAIYESGKIGVCGQGADWHFCEKAGPITENEFARRYARITESSELAEHDTHRRKGQLAGGVALAVAGLGLAAVGGFLVADAKTTDDRLPGAMLIPPGAAGVVFGGLLFVSSIRNSDGKPQEHALSEYDGRLYAERYNRALLRRGIQDVQKGTSLQAISASPIVTPTFVGLQGQF